EMVPAISGAFGGSASVTWKRGYPVTVNAARQAAFAAGIAARVAGGEKVDTDLPPTMGGEDFSFMLQARPGAFIFLGQGGTAQLHQDSYDFNDDIIPVGCSYWATLVETAMPLE
ncbi:MAG TPA: M20/M25/M40 family metallo-hydrolase, partial [Devosiaceae bacterium]|nr:M20/M25/M40 family metallo-hydrolase [Devosiaceae bacterium]